MTKKHRHAMRRTTRKALIVVVFFVVMPIVVVLDHQFGDSVRHYVEQLTYVDGDFQKYHRKTFTVLEVIDGDTLDIDLPDGEHEDTRIRLIGVDTPETKHPQYDVMYFGPEATEFTTQKALGKKVTLLLDPTGDVRDRYGRLLAYVVLPCGDVLNAELIKQGYGYAYLSFPHSYFTEYQSLMEEAMTARVGLWANVTREQLPQWLRSKRPELLRYPR